MADEGEVDYDFENVALFFAAYLVLFLAFSIPCTILLWLRRRKYPIKGRMPLSLIAANILFSTMVVIICLKNIIEGYPCYLVYWQFSVLVTLLGTIYIVRGWNLIFNFELSIARALEFDREHDVGQPALEASKERSSSVSENLDSDGSTSFSRLAHALSLPRDTEHPGKEPPHVWFLDNRHLTETGTLCKYSSVFFVLVVSPFAVIFALHQPEELGKPVCATYIAGDAYILILSLVIMGILVYIGVRMREVVDGYFIKREFKWTAAAGLAMVATWFVLVALSNNKSFDLIREVFPFHMLLAVVLITVLFVCSTVIPLRASFRTTMPKPAAGPKSIRSLQGLLDHPKGRRAYRQHLISEFSVENLVFYDEVNEFREAALEMMAEAETSASGGRMKQILYVTVARMVLMLYRKFFVKGCDYEINVPAKIREDIEERVAVFRDALEADDSARESRTSSHQTTGTLTINVQPPEDENEAPPILLAQLSASLEKEATDPGPKLARTTSQRHRFERHKRRQMSLMVTQHLRQRRLSSRGSASGAARNRVMELSGMVPQQIPEEKSDVTHIDADKPSMVAHVTRRLCQECMEPFAGDAPRFNCGVCGDVFCGSCSSNEAVCSYQENFSPVRVCDSCWAKNSRSPGKSSSKSISRRRAAAMRGSEETSHRRSASDLPSEWAIDHTVFDAAQRNIFQLMESDSFQRFCLTPMYSLLLEQHREESVQRSMHSHLSNLHTQEDKGLSTGGYGGSAVPKLKFVFPESPSSVRSTSSASKASRRGQSPGPAGPLQPSSRSSTRT